MPGVNAIAFLSWWGYKFHNRYETLMQSRYINFCTCKSPFSKNVKVYDWKSRIGMVFFTKKTTKETGETQCLLCPSLISKHFNCKSNINKNYSCAKKDKRVFSVCLETWNLLLPNPVFVLPLNNCLTLNTRTLLYTVMSLKISNEKITPNHSRISKAEGNLSTPFCACKLSQSLSAYYYHNNFIITSELNKSFQMQNSIHLTCDFHGSDPLVG